MTSLSILRTKTTTLSWPVRKNAVSFPHRWLFLWLVFATRLILYSVEASALISFLQTMEIRKSFVYMIKENLLSTMMMKNPNKHASAF